MDCSHTSRDFFWLIDLAIHILIVIELKHTLDNFSYELYIYTINLTNLSILATKDTVFFLNR